MDKRIDFFPEALEHTADALDQASNVEMLERVNNIKAAQLANLPEKHHRFDGEHCVDCNVVIPDERLQMGKVRCVLCQADREVEAKQYSRGGSHG